MPVQDTQAAADPASRTQQFRERFYPQASHQEWNDWRWQLRHRIKDLDHLARFIQLSEDERSAIERHEGPLLSLIHISEPTRPY